MRSVSVRKINHYYKYCILPIDICFCIIYTVFQLSMAKTHQKKHRAIKISTQHKENRICQNRIVCSNLICSNTSGTPKIRKQLEDLGNLYIKLLQKELAFYHALVKNKNCFRERKSFCFFSKIKQLSPKKILLVLLGTNTN